ncbi:MAG: hypothetical protein GF315_02440 [candidate division Zixibacteria bacterium]|nr:hypothetical protein [candidate division Zixibacteria bacterium]
MVSNENTLKYWIKKHPGIRQALASIVAKVPLAFRMGKRFWMWYSLFQESERWSVDQMLEYQFECLRSLLSKLSLESEFYRKRLNGVNIAGIDTVEQFRALVPTVSRDEFAANYDSILANSWKKQKLAGAATSGTTGKALQFYHTSDDAVREWAAICHQWSRVGYVPGESRRAEFRGLTRPGRLVDVFPEHNMIRCSVLDLKAEQVSYYADCVGKYKIEFYHGYPSALHLLASTITSHNINFPQPKAVLLASEEVYDWQLESIQRAFPRSKLYAHYGCAERTALAGWCEYRREYHVMPQYALVEVDRSNSEIIGTNLFNTVNGFVRYRMTDTVLSVSQQPCPDCRRPYIPRLVDLGGRSEDYLFDLERGWIPPAVVTYPLKGLKVIREIRFVQCEREEITVQYTTNLPEDDRAVRTELDKIESSLRRLFSNGTRFKFEWVEEFPRTRSGKFKWIINELDEAGFLTQP